MDLWRRAIRHGHDIGVTQRLPGRLCDIDEDEDDDDAEFEDNEGGILG